jgi:hypothetical protein
MGTKIASLEEKIEQRQLLSPISDWISSFNWSLPCSKRFRLIK